MTHHQGKEKVVKGMGKAGVFKVSLEALSDGFFYKYSSCCCNSNQMRSWWRHFRGWRDLDFFVYLDAVSQRWVPI